MLQSTSWQQYVLFLSITTVLYYLFVWIIFYKAKFPILTFIGNLRHPSMQGEDQPDEVMTTAQHIIDELRPVFAGKVNKNELVLALQGTLKRYSEWSEPGFRETINQFIATQSEAICSIHLSEADLRAVWS